MGGGSGSSSSGEEEEDEELKAAINSIVTTSDAFVTKCFSGDSASISGTAAVFDKPSIEDDPNCKSGSRLPKHYQIKAQKLLDDILDRNLVMVKDAIEIPDIGNKEDGGGIRLFKKAPPGIVFDHSDEPQGPKKRPRILPGVEVDEKSKEFRRKIRCCVVDGSDVVTAAADACKRSIARWEAKDAAAKEAARKEEERVAELRKIRGERWLPSIAAEIQQKFP